MISKLSVSREEVVDGGVRAWSPNTTVWFEAQPLHVLATWPQENHLHSLCLSFSTLQWAQ